MTKKESFDIFKAVGVDVRNLDIPSDEAVAILLSSEGDGAAAVREQLIEMGGIPKKETTLMRTQRNKAIWNEAYLEGMKAAQAKKPRTMVIVEHSNQLDDDSPPRKVWIEPEGVCGFAWVVVRPGTCSFALHMKKNHGASKHYRGGMAYYISHFNQSHERKMAFASAFAQVLKAHGIKAYSEGRLD